MAHFFVSGWSAAESKCNVHVALPKQPINCDNICERNTSTMVEMHEDNIFQQKMLFSNLLFANGVVTCVVVMKCEWELKCKQMSAVVSCCLG